MSIEPWAAARQQVEDLLIQAGRSRAVADIAAARQALEQFKAEYPGKVYAVAALTQALDGLDNIDTRKQFPRL
jgi:hypothetical protein